MTLMWVYDLCKEDDYDIALRKKYDELFGLKEGETITYKDAVTIMNNNEDIDKHIPRVD